MKPTYTNLAILVFLWTFYFVAGLSLILFLVDYYSPWTVLISIPLFITPAVLFIAWVRDQ
jgi:hypothetical protein